MEHIRLVDRVRLRLLNLYLILLRIKLNRPLEPDELPLTTQALAEINAIAQYLEQLCALLTHTK